MKLRSNESFDKLSGALSGHYMKMTIDTRYYF